MLTSGLPRTCISEQTTSTGGFRTWNFLLFENYGQEVGEQYIVGPPQRKICGTSVPRSLRLLRLCHNSHHLNHAVSGTRYLWCIGVARICCEEGQRLKLCHGALMADFRAGCSSCSMTDSFVTNAVLIERVVSYWHMHQLISQTTQYLVSRFSDLKVEGGRAPVPHNWRRHCPGVTQIVLRWYFADDDRHYEDRCRMRWVDLVQRDTRQSSMSGQRQAADGRIPPVWLSAIKPFTAAIAGLLANVARNRCTRLQVVESLEQLCL